MRIGIVALFLFPILSLAAYAESLKSDNPLQKDTISGLELVTIPAGCFQMGNISGYPYYIEMPVHEVCVSEFSIGKFDVTRAAFRGCIEKAGFALEAEYFFQDFRISENGKNRKIWLSTRGQL